MRRLSLAVVMFLVSLGAVNGQQAHSPAATSETTSGRSAYDPLARGKGPGQPKGIVETTLAGVNPQNKDYGVTVGDWRKEVFENTIGRIYFWSLVLLSLVLGSSVMANGWFLRERERRLTISADIVVQLFNAYIGSRAKALEVIAKYNSLVDRYNRLECEKKQLKEELTRIQAQAPAGELDYEQARQDKGSRQIAPSEEPPVAENSESEVAAERSEVEVLRSQLVEYETKLQRKTAQLQAKENQISNLRSRLTRAHDSLEGERQQKPVTK